MDEMDKLVEQIGNCANEMGAMLILAVQEKGGTLTTNITGDANAVIFSVISMPACAVGEAFDTNDIGAIKNALSTLTDIVLEKYKEAIKDDAKREDHKTS